jgi:hypothetical protein
VDTSVSGGAVVHLVVELARRGNNRVAATSRGFMIILESVGDQDDIIYQNPRRVVITAVTIQPRNLTSRRLELDKAEFT